MKIILIIVASIIAIVVMYMGIRIILKILKDISELERQLHKNDPFNI
jgi:hypothetical protein